HPERQERAPREGAQPGQQVPAEHGRHEQPQAPREHRLHGGRGQGPGRRGGPTGATIPDGATGLDGATIPDGATGLDGATIPDGPDGLVVVTVAVLVVGHRPAAGRDPDPEPDPQPGAVGADDPGTSGTHARSDDPADGRRPAPGLRL